MLTLMFFYIFFLRGLVFVSFVFYDVTAGEERDRQQVNYWCFRAVIEGMTRKGNSIGLALTGQPNGGTQGKSVHYLGSDLLACPGILIFCTTSKLSLCFVHTLALVFFVFCLFPSEYLL